MLYTVNITPIVKNLIPQLIRGVRPPRRKKPAPTQRAGKPAENPTKNPRTPQTQTTNQRVGGTKNDHPQKITQMRQTKEKEKKRKKAKPRTEKKTREKRKTAAAGEQEIPKNKALCRGENERNGNKMKKGAKHTNSSELKSIPLHRKPSPTRYHATARKKQGTHCDNSRNTHPQKPKLRENGYRIITFASARNPKATPEQDIPGDI